MPLPSRYSVMPSTEVTLIGALICFDLVALIAVVVVSVGVAGNAMLGVKIPALNMSRVISFTENP